MLCYVMILCYKMLCYTQGDSDVISFRIYASWLSRHLVGTHTRLTALYPGLPR